MKNAVKIVSFMMIAFCFSILFVHTAAASDTIYYFKLDAAYKDIDSDDFDGGFGIFESNNDVSASFPDIDDGGHGFGITFGGIRGHWGGEIYVRWSEHDGDFYGGDYNAYDADIDFYEIGGNIKYYFVEFDRTVFNGYVLAGLAYTKLKAEDAGYNSSNDAFGDVTFRGKTYNLGLGGTCRLGNHFGLEAQYIYGFNHIMRVRTLGERGKPEDDVDSEIQTFNFGMNYYF